MIPAKWVSVCPGIKRHDNPQKSAFDEAAFELYVTRPALAAATIPAAARHRPMTAKMLPVPRAATSIPDDAGMTN